MAAALREVGCHLPEGSRPQVARSLDLLGQLKPSPGAGEPALACSAGPKEASYGGEVCACGWRASFPMQNVCVVLLCVDFGGEGLQETTIFQWQALRFITPTLTLVRAPPKYFESAVVVAQL